MNDILFEVQDLNKTIDSQYILKHISLKLHRGEILGIYGSNASSKSSLIRALSGNLVPSSGTFLVNGQPRTIRTPHQAAEAGIMALLCPEQLLGNLSIAENIFLGSYSRLHSGPSYRKSDTKAAALRLMEQYDCSVDLCKPVSSLSTLEKQLLLLLRAEAYGAKIILIDDFFFSFNEKENREFAGLVRHMSQSGCSFLIASQNLRQLQTLTDSVCLIRDGMLSSRLKAASISADDLHTIPYPKLRTQIGPMLYQCRNLCCGTILKHISLDVRAGEIIGILGANGSGRTTLAKAISGMYRISCDEILLNNIPIPHISSFDARKHGIALISDDTLYHGLLPAMNIEDNIMLGSYRLAPSRLPFLISSSKSDYYTTTFLEKLGIDPERKHEKIQNLNSSTQKKVAIAKSIISGTQLLLFDEPTKGIDCAGKTQIYNIMTELSRSSRGILLFTSDINEALGMCDRIYILQHGTIIREITPAKVTARELSSLIN